MRAKSTAKGPRPTGAELEILNVLWSRGPATVREVHAVLEQRRAMGYTTVLKLMQIMAEKGILTRRESGRAHVYTAAQRREDTQKRAVSELIDNLFGGSAAQLALRALSDKRATQAELQEIRHLLDAHERGRR